MCNMRDGRYMYISGMGLAQICNTQRNWEKTVHKYTRYAGYQGANIVLFIDHGKPILF